MIREEDILKSAEKLAHKRPAFPTVIDDRIIVEGLTRRELFAAMAMQGLVTGKMCHLDEMHKDIAQEAIKIADHLCAGLDMS